MMYFISGEDVDEIIGGNGLNLDEITFVKKAKDDDDFAILMVKYESESDEVLMQEKQSYFLTNFILDLSVPQEIQNSELYDENEFLYSLDEQYQDISYKIERNPEQWGRVIDKVILNHVLEMYKVEEARVNEEKLDLIRSI